jgi:hypothetical protein
MIVLVISITLALATQVCSLMRVDALLVRFLELAEVSPLAVSGENSVEEPEDILYLLFRR